MMIKDWRENFIFNELEILFKVQVSIYLLSEWHQKGFFCVFYNQNTIGGGYKIFRLIVSADVCHKPHE